MSNRLFPIPVRGIRTAEVESLPSYVHRLAYRHGVFVGELLRFVVRQAERDKSYSGQLVTLPHHIYVHDLLRSNGLAQGLVSIFEHLTHQCLAGTTVTVFSGPLTMSRGELHAGFRWCPECFTEMAMMGEEPYFKLIWQFKAIQACPIHYTPLLVKCDHCGCDQTSYIKRRALDFCQDCGAPLSVRGNMLELRDFASSWQDIGRDIVELFRDLSEYGYNSLPDDGVFQSLDGIFDDCLRRQRGEDFNQILDCNQLSSFGYRMRILSLNTARKVAFRLGISLYDLLSGNAVQASRSFNYLEFCPFPSSFMGASPRFKRDHEALLHKLQQLMEDEVKPLSLKAVARALEVSVGYLEYRFPVQVRYIVERNQDFLSSLRLQKYRCAQEKALRYFVSGAHDAPKSRKQAYFSIRAETGLPKFLLKSVIQDVYLTLTKPD